MATQIQNRFDPAKNYERHLFRADKVLQSAELNEVQSAAAHKLAMFGDALFRDGDIVRDARIVVNAQTGVTQCESGALYLAGAVRGVPSRTIAVPVLGVVAVGLYLHANVVTELQDPALLNPAAGTRGYQEPGAAREQITPSWGHAGDGQPGEFYPVWVVEDGIVRPKDPPPTLDSVTQAMARYDRDSAGGTYIVRGLDVAASADQPDGRQVYTVGEGRARVNGYGVELVSSRRLVYDTAADLKAVDSEPHQSTTIGVQRITLDRPPCLGVPQVRITARRTVDVIHGGFSGAADPLPDNGVILIETVKQGGTTYTQGTDYALTAGQVNWAAPGAEPAPGSTYQVTYQHIANVAPTNVTPTAFDVAGALPGTLVLVSYQQMLRRIDRLCMDEEGRFQWVRGVSAEWSPSPPVAPPALLPLASVYQSWDSQRRVVQDGVRMVPMDEIAAYRNRLAAVIEDQAELRLSVDISGRHSGVKKGLFADPFISDAMRDAGVSQTGAIVGGALRLPLQVQVHELGTSIVNPQAPAHGYSVALQQPMRTGSMLVNPYMAFQALPAVCTLTPAVDRWTETSTQWTSAITERMYTGSGGNAVLSHTGSTVRTISEASSNIEHLRQIKVRFDLQGFGPGEALAAVAFDGIGVVPTALPSGTLIATAAGVLSGQFTIPAGVPAGVKDVAFTGSGGSTAAQFFTGQGTAVLRTQQEVVTEVWELRPPPPSSSFVIGPSGGGSAGTSNPCAGKFVIGPSTDPLAQTFTLGSATQLAGVDLWFTARQTEVVVQIRETQVGIPNSTILIEKRVPASQIATDGPTRVTWAPAALSGGQEYALVVLCDDAVTALAIAELGKFDPAAGWVTSQPYQVGVLLSSSNANTWTPHQDRDLAFRLLRADYTEAERVIDLGTVDLANATDLMVMGFAERPSADASCVFEIVLGTESVQVVDGQVIWLASAYTGPARVFARLRGSATTAAVLQPGVQLIAGTLQGAGTYVSPMLTAGGDVSVRVVFEAEIPGGAAVAVHAQTSAPGAPWVEVPYASASAATAGVREITHMLASIVGDGVRLRLTLTGNTTARPSVRNLRAVVL